MKKLRIILAVALTAILLLLVILMARFAFSLVGKLTSRQPDLPPQGTVVLLEGETANPSAQPPEELPSLSDMAYEASLPQEEEDDEVQEELISVPVYQTSEELALEQQRLEAQAASQAPAVSGEEG